MITEGSVSSSLVIQRYKIIFNVSKCALRFIFYIKEVVFSGKNWAQFGLAFASKSLLFPIFYYFYYFVILYSMVIIVNTENKGNNRNQGGNNGWAVRKQMVK